MKTIRLKIQKFMVGRYGMDKLSTILLYVGLAFIFLFNLLNLPFGGLVGWVAIIISYFRALSRNRTKRYIENQKYLALSRRGKQKFNQLRNKFYQRKQYKYYACPNCKKKLRVPRKKGSIKITCPHCKESFVKKT
ncbi:hypothetical protein [Carnobacterium funditum]|uniref:hypothetical protein n=1 Tax=Carnobacterium funditum TaxID=2752 RepID=UPI00068FDE3C|nr:hypothetical protein [Carnobacterium funditum]